MPVNLASRRDLDEGPKLSSDEDEENAMTMSYKLLIKLLRGSGWARGHSFSHQQATDDHGNASGGE